MIAGYVSVARSCKVQGSAGGILHLVGFRQTSPAFQTLTATLDTTVVYGMGEVYRARDTKLDRDVALKLRRFASVQSVVQNLFRVGRHLLRPVHHRLLRARAFVKWDVVTCAC